MRLPDLLTPAERRLAVLLFVLAAVGSAVHWSRGISPEVAAWLDRGPAPPVDGAVEDIALKGIAPDSSRRVEDERARSGTSGGASAIPAPAPEPPPGGAVDPNTAPAEALTALPGIGPALAGRIVADREAHGPYRRPEDLLRVKGIGPATLGRIRSRLRLGGP